MCNLFYLFFSNLFVSNILMEFMFIALYVKHLSHYAFAKLSTLHTLKYFFLSVMLILDVYFNLSCTIKAWNFRQTLVYNFSSLDSQAIVVYPRR